MFLSSINLLSLLVSKKKKFEFSLVIHTYTQKENKKETRNEKELRTEHLPGNGVI